MQYKRYVGCIIKGMEYVVLEGMEYVVCVEYEGLSDRVWRIMVRIWIGIMMI